MKTQVHADARRNNFKVRQKPALLSGNSAAKHNERLGRLLLRQREIKRRKERETPVKRTQRSDSKQRQKG